jgi:hypothetical protein
MPISRCPVAPTLTADTTAPIPETLSYSFTLPAALASPSLAYRSSTLRLIAYDSHPRHTQPHLATACDTRRRAALRVLACVCRACDGNWGFGESREPGGGTRMWATLPRASAATYGRTTGYRKGREPGATRVGHQDPAAPRHVR